MKLFYNFLIYNTMKKKQLDFTNKIYINPSKGAQIHIKQSYKFSRSQNKSTSKQRTNLSNAQPEQLAKSSKYRAYLQNQIVPKLKINRRYLKKEEEHSISRRKGTTSRNERNESFDLIRIRKSKVSSSHKVNANSYTKLDDHYQPFQTAKQLYKVGKFSEALQIAEQCLKRESENKQYIYYTAIIHLNLQNYAKGLQLLTKICKNNPEYKKTAFLFAAISAKHLQQLERAYILCSNGIEHYPNYTTLIEYRANISLLKQNYQDAHEDYQKILQADSQNIQILLKNADCLQKMGAYTNCLQNLTNAMYIDKGKYRQEILTRRIQIFLSPKAYNIKEAKKDLNKLMTSEIVSPDVNYLKGIVLQAEGFKKQSILAFEQCLKQGSEKQIMSKALIEIVKNKIADRDFYSALYHINRYKYFELSGQQIQMYKIFSEGVVHLMKRKVVEGDKNFTSLLEKHKNLTPDLKRIFHLYRAFTKFSLSQYPEAIESYELAGRQQQMDNYSKFNKQLAQGINEIIMKNYEKGLEYFNLAQRTISVSKVNKIDPFLYRAGTYIQQAKDSLTNTNNEELKSLELMFTGLKQLDKAYDINDSNSNLLYYRALVYLYLGKFEQSLQDIIKAISKSQQNVAKYFFFRGIIQNSLNNSKQALNDFNICCNLDEKFRLVYLERAKIHFANQNVTKGLEDLVKLRNINPKQDIKFHETCLNYFHGHFTMANASCDEIANAENCLMIKIMIKTKLGKIKEARKLSRKSADTMIFDILLGKSEIKEASSSQLEFFTMYHYHLYLGVKYFRQMDYAKALESFTMSAKQRNLFDLEQGIANNNLSQQNEQQMDEQNDNDAIHKINYNIFLCYLQLKQWKKAYELFIRDIIGAKEQFVKNQFVSSFSHLLFQAMKQSSHKILQQNKEIYQLNLYDTKLDRVLPQFLIELPNIIMKTRLCLLAITNPKLEKQYRTKVNPDFILEYMNMSQIQNRPEPPWVKREEAGLIFTDEIQNINIQFVTTENEDENQQNQEQQQDNQQGQDEEENDQNEQSQGTQLSQGKNKFSKSKFKQQTKLNDSIEKKLQKIMEMKKKNSS